MKRGDVAHLGLMMAALGLAYLLPFELLLLSYAILGPAHYLTQISWLHDRSYYLPHKGLALGLAGASLAAMFIADPGQYGLLVWSAFAACAVLALGRTWRQRAILGALFGAATAVLALLPSSIVILGMLLPTVIHVCIFTLAFMLLGAVRSASRAQFALVGVYLVAIAAIFLAPPSAGTVIPVLARLGEYYFGGVAPALGSLFGVPDLAFDARITGFLSFIYTYHYLNWFIKADVIRWAEVPKLRLAAVAGLSAAATGLYFYDYVLGFNVLLLLSMMHVLLEFPLNALTFRDLSAAVGRGAQGLVRRPA